MSTSLLQTVLGIANQFETHDKITAVTPHGSGNVNDTYIATASSGTRYILQRVNTSVFSAPHIVMSNMHKATQHIQRCIEKENLAWKVQKILPTKQGKYYLDDASQGFWRMISFIEESQSFDTLDSQSKALELGRAVGLFHTLMAKASPDDFTYVLEAFHVVPIYLSAYDETVRNATLSYGSDERHAAAFIEQHRSHAVALERAKAEGILPLRIIHGDLKINNIMFDRHNDKAVSIIDLDTVQPGLIHYDIGDCMRSSCNKEGEETQSWKEVTFDRQMLRHIWRGYLSQASGLMEQKEYAYVYDAIFTIAFEMGLRFFTDYLNGDTYFKIHYPKNNLFRALVQFQLAHSIQEQKEEIMLILQEEKALVDKVTT